MRLARPLVNALREPAGGHYRVNHLKRFMEASGLEPAERWQRYQAIADRTKRRALYQPHIAREIDFDAVDDIGSAYFKSADASDPLDRALYQDFKFYLPDDILALTDRVGMWHSLELRVPFVDHTLVEFCARLPTSLKLKRGEKKHLLRTAARPLLPPSVLDHRKQGFAAPMAMWLRGGMREHVRAFLDRASIAQSGVLAPVQVEQRLAAHDARQSLNDKSIFTVLMFERWWRRHQGHPDHAGVVTAAIARGGG
jgi:asparagine synthase (glutamine-hydrolysing)